MTGAQLLQDAINALLAEGKKASEIHSLLLNHLDALWHNMGGGAHSSQFDLTTEPDCVIPGHWPEPPPDDDVD